jgi:uncharacterized protein YcfJ
MHKIALVFAAALTLSACQTTNEQNGAVLGGVAGGLLGNTIGKGSGKAIATGAGALIGVIAGSSVGRNMDQPRTIIYQNGSGPCSNLGSEGERSACERGSAKRNEKIQRQKEDRAYRCGRYGQC